MPVPRFTPTSYDPLFPVRAPESKRSIPLATVEMASIIALLAVADADGCVTKDDLHRAGFSNGEIDACHADAVFLARQRLQPRRVGGPPKARNADTARAA